MPALPHTSIPDRCFFILEPISKHGEKYSALELSIKYIYPVPFPRESIDLSIVSPFSSPSTTPVKSRQAAAHAASRTPAKVTKINFD